MEKARAFYRDALGLAQTAKDDFATVFDLAGVPLRIVPSVHAALGSSPGQVLRATDQTSWPPSIG